MSQSPASAPSTETLVSVPGPMASPAHSVFSPFRLLSSAAALVGLSSGPALPAPATLPAAALQAPAPMLPAPPAPSVVLQSTGPWVAGTLYSVVPPQDLVTIPGHDDELWYTILRGKYIGVVQDHTLALDAMVGISNNAMKSYKTQALAVAAFNAGLGGGLAQIHPY
ncbi:hypothetical protein FB451DRAFT_1395474 [Mycena latifolia]|nr:hypothetical protein FB451DRAFT_1395474 [Mycena latifolia]